MRADHWPSGCGLSAAFLGWERAYVSNMDLLELVDVKKNSGHYYSFKDMELLKNVMKMTYFLEYGKILEKLR